MNLIIISMAKKDSLDVFEKDRERVLHEREDLSLKGSIDKPIIDLIHYINTQIHFYTTSSCSGRIIIFAEVFQNKKKGCKWLLTSHEPISLQQIRDVLYDNLPQAGYVHFKFEPFVLHVTCKCLSHAKHMLQAAVSSGFRNSGISVNRRERIVLGVRSTHFLQAPVAYNGRLIVTDEYLNHLVILGNERLSENFQRIERFYQQVKSVYNPDETPSPSVDNPDETPSPSVDKNLKIENHDTKEIHKHQEVKNQETGYDEVNTSSDNDETIDCIAKLFNST